MPNQNAILENLGSGVNGRAFTGSALSFDGTNDLVTITISSVATTRITMWLRLTSVSTTEELLVINRTGTPATIVFNSGVVASTGFTSFSSTVLQGSIALNQWFQIQFDFTSINVNTLEIGWNGTNYGAFLLAEFQTTFGHYFPQLFFRSSLIDYSGNERNGVISGATFVNDLSGLANGETHNGIWQVVTKNINTYLRINGELRFPSLTLAVGQYVEVACFIDNLEFRTTKQSPDDNQDLLIPYVSANNVFLRFSGSSHTINLGIQAYRHCIVRLTRNSVSQYQVQLDGGSPTLITQSNTITLSAVLSSDALLDYIDYNGTKYSSFNLNGASIFTGTLTNRNILQLVTNENQDPFSNAIFRNTISGGEKIYFNGGYVDTRTLDQVKTQPFTFAGFFRAFEACTLYDSRQGSAQGLVITINSSQQIEVRWYGATGETRITTTSTITYGVNYFFAITHAGGGAAANFTIKLATIAGSVTDQGVTIVTNTLGTYTPSKNICFAGTTANTSIQWRFWYVRQLLNDTIINQLFNDNKSKYV